MRLAIPENLQGKELFKFLSENKKQLIATKKAEFKQGRTVLHVPQIVSATKTAAEKAASGEADESPVHEPGKGEVLVTVVANTAWWCDESMDVLTDTCYEKSVKEKGVLIPHIHDHIHKSTAHVGDVRKVYTDLVPIKDLGYEVEGSTTALIFQTLVREDYNADVYKFYRNGKINQHSIGLLYLSIGLCINDKDYLPEYELFQKYYPRVINKDAVDERGYFWIVPEIRVLENSCVLFGCNGLTPTLSVSADTQETPSGDTSEEPSDKALTLDTFFKFQKNSQHEKALV